MSLGAPLSNIAHARSGDKGSHANIAVIAYTAEGYRFLKKWLTAERVKDFFSALGPTAVERFEIPNLLAFNFVLKDALGGGASRSLWTDTQGKTLATRLLNIAIHDPPCNLSAMRRLPESSNE